MTLNETLFTTTDNTAVTNPDPYGITIRPVDALIDKAAIQQQIDAGVKAALEQKNQRIRALEFANTVVKKINEIIVKENSPKKHVCEVILRWDIYNLLRQVFEDPGLLFVGTPEVVYGDCDGRTVKFTYAISPKPKRGRKKRPKKHQPPILTEAALNKHMKHWFDNYGDKPNGGADTVVFAPRDTFKAVEAIEAGERWEIKEKFSSQEGNVIA